MFVSLSNYLQTKASFSDAELKAIEAKCDFVSLKKGEKLLDAGSYWTDHAFVYNGLLRSYQEDLSGKEQTIAFSPENYWTGDRESLLMGTPSLINIIAETDADIIIINYDNYYELCVTVAAFGEFMNLLIQRNLEARKQRAIEHILTDNEKLNKFLEKFPSVMQRTQVSNIASFLGIDLQLLENLLATRHS